MFAENVNIEWGRFLISYPRIYTLIFPSLRKKEHFLHGSGSEVPFMESGFLSVSNVQLTILKS